MHTTRSRTRTRQGIGTVAAAVILVLGSGMQPANAQSGGALRFLKAVTYDEGRTQSVGFSPTFRLARASGEAKVQRKEGITEVEIELDEYSYFLLSDGYLP